MPEVGSVKSGVASESLAARLESKVLSGQWLPGQKLPSVRVLAKEHNAGIGTVARALERLAELGLVEPQHGRGVFVKKFKDQQASRRKIALLYLTESSCPLTAVGSPYGYTIFEACKQFCQDANFSVMLNPLYADKDRVRSSIEDICNSTKVDGLLLMYAGEEQYRDVLPCLEDVPVPMVLVDKPFGKTHKFSYIAGDNLHIGIKAAEYLVNHGHSNICAVMRNHQRCQQEQLLGFRTALQANDMELADEDCYFENDKREAVAKVAERIKQSLENGNPKERITAIHCGSDLDAMALIEQLQMRSVQIPQDVSVIGGGGCDMAAHLHPALTSVTIGIKDMGIRACEMLQDLIENPDRGPIQETLDAHVVERESSRSLKPEECTR